jgi:hypothetical protein
MLDKSKGLVLGSELVANGDFSGGTTGWSAANSATIAVTSGVAQVTQTSSNLAAIRQSITTVVGRSYRVSCAIASQNGAGIVAIAQDTGTFAVIAQSAVVSSTDQTTVTLTFVATATTTFVSARFNASGASGNTFTVDNISVKELPGNHAVQATTANRPIYGIHPVGGRRNLLVRTEEFENAVWAKSNSTITANTSVAPDGTTTADTLFWATSTAPQVTTATAVTIPAGSPVTLSGYAKAGTKSSFRLILFTDGSNYAEVAFNISAGTAGTPAVAGTRYTAASASIVNVGNGWYRCSISASTNTLTTVYSWLRADTAVGSGDSILIWGAQLETGSTATAYQRVTDQYNVTEAGVSSVSYLFFDGVNDSLATSTITPGVNKAQVFAGVRKLSDAAVGTVAELSTTVANSGSLSVRAPTTTGVAGYAFASNGTALVTAFATGFAAPITNVLTGIGDISGDVSRLRVNGTQVAELLTDQGTGNFLAYPLYIGARAGTSLFFSGHLYSLITRFGPNLDTGQISSTETWVAGKTGIEI